MPKAMEAVVFSTIVCINNPAYSQWHTVNRQSIVLAKQNPSGYAQTH
jgi:hypothetical protein